MNFQRKMLQKKTDSVFPTFQDIERLIESFGLNRKPDMEGAVELDDFPFTESGLSYHQKVWRLKNREIYVETVPTINTEYATLQEQLDRAVSEQRFEDAAHIRDMMKALKNQ